MKAKEIADLTTEEVKEKIEIETEDFNKMKLNHAVAAFENPVQLRLKRRDIARLKTELRKRELADK
jgi:large subunit ribosomal protein L29